MTVLLWVWFGFTALAALVWTSRHLQINRAQRDMPPLTCNLFEGETSELPTLSMIVAAKDEEKNIGDCLTSLLNQDLPRLQVVAVNDRSEDETGPIMDAIASRDARLQAVHVSELRDGWFGKCNAMREGVALADGEWLCFTDADCVFHDRRMLTIALRWALREDVDFVSVLPVHKAHGFWERVIQPACSGILMIWFSPILVNDPKHPAAYANGAFMLMKRSCYEAIGGHEGVRSEVNEDMHLAKRAKANRQRLRVVGNDGLYSVRMYSTLTEMWSGWTRIFAGCFESRKRLILSILMVSIMGLSPWLALAASVISAAFGAGIVWQSILVSAMIACAAQTSVMIRFYALNHTGAMFGVLYPIGAVFGLGAMIAAWGRVTGRKSLTWRGTTYKGGEVTPK